MGIAEFIKGLAPGGEESDSPETSETTATSETGETTETPEAKEPEESKAPKGDKATDLLKEDHAKVKELFEKFEKESKSTEKKKLIKTIIDELTLHTSIEEKLIYPIVAKKDGGMAEEALQEHHVVKFILRELKGAKTINKTIDAKVKVLKEMVTHHIKEEESELFPKLESSGQDMNKLGAQIKAKKQGPKKAAAKGKKTSTTKKPTPSKKKVTTSKKASKKPTPIRSKSKSKSKAKTAKPRSARKGNSGRKMTRGHKKAS